MAAQGGSPAGPSSGRQQKRIEVGLKMRVRGKDRHGVPFDDTVYSNNVSRTGASFRIERELEVGQTIEIVIPPRVGRDEADFVTTAKIVRVQPTEVERERIVGVQFERRFLRVFVSEGEL
jgi:hypothetical protein